jgi:Double zinc ribbon
MLLALFGITNDALNLVVNLLILFLVVLWLALVAWTYFDARRRIQDPVLVACATAASLFPFLGTIVYSILRPPEFLADKREREIETRSSELRVRQLEEASCPNCEHPIERSYLRCPNCRARIKDPCESCGKPIDPRWSICPYCETPVRRAAPPEERRPSKRRAKEPSSSSSKPPPTRGRSTRKSSSPSPSPSPSRDGAADAEPTRKSSTPSSSSRPTRSSRSTSSRSPSSSRPSSSKRDE